METGFVHHKAPGTARKTAWLLMLMSVIQMPVFAQAKEASKASYYNPAFLILSGVIILLLIVILIFADVAKAAIRNRSEQEKAKREASGGLKALLLILSVGLSNALLAQAPAATSVVAAVQPVKTGYWGIDAPTFWMMISLIVFELFVAWKFYAIAMQQLGTAQRRKLAAAEKARLKAIVVKRPSMLDKLNASVAIEKEADIMLDHNYDGIRELDNNLPPWWKYGFYLTIAVAVIYLLHFHVFHTGKLQLGEYEDQLLQAKVEMAEYRKKAANLVDENNAVALTDNASLAAGKATFTTNCVACHGGAGEGGVGPNLTDEYWLHEGDIKDIFKTIKYGYPEKGMKSWQQDLGAKQIHEVASYVKSLQGSNPSNPKAKEGELYRTQAPADTLKAPKQ